ncbi:GrpB family protein [Streptomyces sp. M10(2022)]
MADLDEPVRVVAHAPHWAERGRYLVRRVSAPLRALSVDVEHIGSTAVPGLDAKPVIDVQVGCLLGDMPTAVACVEQLGYEHLGRPVSPGVNICADAADRPPMFMSSSAGADYGRDNIMFRDYLASHPGAADPMPARSAPQYSGARACSRTPGSRPGRSRRSWPKHARRLGTDSGAEAGAPLSADESLVCGRRRPVRPHPAACRGQSRGSEPSMVIV